MFEISIDLSRYDRFSIDRCLRSGQIFGWKRINDCWYGTAKDRVLRICQKGETLYLASSEEIREEEAINFLGLEDDKKEIDSHLALNPFLKGAISKYSDVRILRQDPFDTIVSYICAQNKNIPAIERMISELSRRFGIKREMDGMAFFSLPTVEKISRLRLENLFNVGLGYRARYLSETARRLSEDRDLVNELMKKTYNDAWAKITSGEAKLAGVGPKAADCILLYGFEKMEAFPIDVWVCKAYTTALRGIMDGEEQRYFESVLCQGRKVDINLYLKLGNAARKVFGKYAGYAQLYTFMYGRDYFRYS
ncbi:MAG: DNA-3-methyladenine glycosylase family protein [Nitrososphaeria archaeon]